MPAFHHLMTAAQTSFGSGGGGGIPDRYLGGGGGDPHFDYQEREP
jgi:hypothetical protein